MDHDRRLRAEALENEPALGGASLVWGYDDVRDEPAIDDLQVSREASAAPSAAIGEEPALAEWSTTRQTDADDLDTYGTVYRRRRAETSLASRTLGLALIVVGMIPLPLVGIFVLQLSGATVLRAVALTMLFPLVLEILKPAVGLALVEGKPWIVAGRASLVVAHMIGGLGFGVFLYGLLEIGPLLFGLTYSPLRLFASMALHGTTALVSGLGVAQVWKRTDSEGRPPVIRVALPYVASAVALHAVYSLAVWVLADSTWAF